MKGKKIKTTSIDHSQKTCCEAKARGRERCRSEKLLVLKIKNVLHVLCFGVDDRDKVEYMGLCDLMEQEDNGFGC